MEIKSPVILWKDYEVETLPLNISELSVKYVNDGAVKEYYFDGYTTVDGRVRAFIKIREQKEPRGVVLFLADGKKDKLSDDIASNIFDAGYTVAELDYLGKTTARSRFTLYPKSLSDCNSADMDKYEITEDEKYSRWYIWTCISRRALYLLKTLYRTENMFALGVGLGGNTVYKLAAFDDGLKGCATLLNILPIVEGEGNGIINYRASLDNYAYAPVLKVPLFMAISSNDEDGSLDEMSELSDETESLDTLRIYERAFHSGIISACPAIAKFFEDRLLGNKASARPSISASNSDGSLYLNITTGEEEPTDSCRLELFVSFCMTEPPYRNWMKMPVIGLGENKFMAKLNVCDVAKPIFAFANLIDKSGNVQSSALLKVMPKTLNIKERSGVAHRKIYDGSMGTDCWTSREGGEIRAVNGPYGIEGVESSTNTIVTFKPGDPLFKVPVDTLLQIMISGEPQTITVSVRDKDNKYSCTVQTTGTEDWNKFSLSHLNFKGDAGMLISWNQVSSLEFSSDSKFIIGSVLWV